MTRTGWIIVENGGDLWRTPNKSKQSWEKSEKSHLGKSTKVYHFRSIFSTDFYATLRHFAARLRHFP